MYYVIIDFLRIVYYTIFRYKQKGESHERPTKSSTRPFKRNSKAIHTNRAGEVQKSFGSLGTSNSNSIQRRGAVAPIHSYTFGGYMKNYYAYSAGLFEVTPEELKKLQKIPLHDKPLAKHYIENHYHKKVEQFDLYYLPATLKRNNWDSAKILAIKFVDESLKAK